MMDSLGDRMKQYEAAWKPQLPPRLPIIVRVDGRAFHSLELWKPFDERMMFAMDNATIKVAQDLQGCLLAYTQSDEASFLLQSDRKLTSQMPWGGDLVKLVSTTAGAMTAAFHMAGINGAHFDARAFVVPWEDVPNYFLWRYRDWVKNSVTMMAQAHFSHRDLHEKHTGDKLGMLDVAGHAWERESARVRHGYSWPSEMVSTAEDRVARGMPPLDYESIEDIVAMLRVDQATVAERTV